MINIMKVKAPYFLALARILLEHKGTADAFGVTYADERTEIRGSADGSAIQVRCKRIASNVPDMIVASRGPDGETFENQHSVLASHLENRASSCLKGERVFVFLVADAGGATSESPILAVDLGDAHGHLRKGLKDADGHVVDLLRVLTVAEAGTAGVADAIPTEALTLARELEACIRAAHGCEDQVYVFTYMPREGKQESWTAKATRPLRAVDLADAERTFRATQDPAMRLAKVEIETLLQFYEGKGKYASTRATLLRSQAVAEREARNVARDPGERA